MTRHATEPTPANTIFNSPIRQCLVMNAGTTLIIIILILAGTITFSGCTGASGPAPQAAVLIPDTITPLRTTPIVTRHPSSEIARITVGHFGMNPATGSIYEFAGTVQVNDGPYRSVQVILRYPDS